MRPQEPDGNTLLASIPFFFDATDNYPMTCRPTCQGPDHPPRYAPTPSLDYMRWFARQYDHVRDQDHHEPDNPGVPDTQASVLRPANGCPLYP